MASYQLAWHVRAERPMIRTVWFKENGSWRTKQVPSKTTRTIATFESEVDAREFALAQPGRHLHKSRSWRARGESQ